MPYLPWLRGVRHKLSMNKTVHLFIFILFIGHCVFGQLSTSKEYIEYADSLIISAVGEESFKNFFVLTQDSYFEYHNRQGKVKWKYSTKEISRKKNTSFHPRYDFTIKSLDYSNLIAFDVQSNGTNTFQSELTNIPPYMLNRQPCNIQQESEAIIKAELFGMKNIDTSWTGILHYNSTLKIFTWEIIGVLKVISKKPYYAAEVNAIELNAVTLDVVRDVYTTTLRSVH